MKIICPRCQAVTNYEVLQRLSPEPRSGKARRWEIVSALYPEQALTKRIHAGALHLGISERTMWRDYRTFKRRLEKDFSDLVSGVTSKRKDSEEPDLAAQKPAT